MSSDILAATTTDTAGISTDATGAVTSVAPSSMASETNTPGNVATGSNAPGNTATGTNAPGNTGTNVPGSTAGTTGNDTTHLGPAPTIPVYTKHN